MSAFLKRWRHLLFRCPTFWRLKPAFQCPACGATYRCYWDGADVGGMTNVCKPCARQYVARGGFWLNEHVDSAMRLRPVRKCKHRD